MGMDGEERRLTKRLRNKRDHAASRSTSDHVLLRLDKGGAATLDAASKQAELSRSAFARLYLGPLISAIAPRLGAIDQASRERGQSLAQFLASAIETALRALPEKAWEDEGSASADFDRIFGVGD